MPLMHQDQLCSYKPSWESQGYCAVIKISLETHLQFSENISQRHNTLQNAENNPSGP